MLRNNKILIVDDEAKIIEFLVSYLIKEGFEVIVANYGQTAIEKFYEQKPSLVILDLMLPDISGEEVCKEIRKCSSVPIIMATAKVDETSILRGFKLGADDYITKPFSPRQLVARVTAILRRTENAISSLSGTYSFYNGDLTININNFEVKKNTAIVNLTHTEYTLLTTMLKYPYKAFTREELVNIIYDTKYLGYERVIDVHIKNLRHKIEANSKEPMYILTVHGVGYKFGGV
jgi:DNA-binding response OmpR family regulator